MAMHSSNEVVIMPPSGINGVMVKSEPSWAEDIERLMTQVSIPVGTMNEVFVLLRMFTSPKVRQIDYLTKQTIRIHCHELLDGQERRIVREILELFVNAPVNIRMNKTQQVIDFVSI